MAEETVGKPKSKNKTKLLIFLVIFLIGIIIAGLVTFQYRIFKAKAEGIAIGYSRAAASAYQMGRQIPDTIFEDGNYRVEIISTQPSGNQPFGVTVNVKDLYTNITHYTLNKNVAVQPVSSAMPR